MLNDHVQNNRNIAQKILHTSGREELTTSRKKDVTLEVKVARIK
jgi:hypothetical protein